MDELQKFILSEIREHVEKVNEIFTGENADHEVERMEYHTDKAISLVDKLALLGGSVSSTEEQ